MAFCPNCGNQVDGRFCAKCGTAVDAAAAAGAAPPSSAPAGVPALQAGGLTDNVACALCYALFFITGILFLVLEPYSLRGGPRRGNQLTDRERQVVTLIAEGNSTKEVAARLGISVKTADCHRTRIMDKLNVHQTANLVRYAIRQGFIEA